MTTLSLTLPISCQICLGKVKEPVICPNNHAFCTVCLDVWLQTNGCCPTCRVDITKEKPYRKVIGSRENNETLSLQNRMQLRKTRLELLGREYETEFQTINCQLKFMAEENDKLKEELKSKELLGRERSLLPKNVEAFSSLTKKLQEISTTYDDVRRDMTKLQQEKDQLQRENDNLKNEVSKLKEDSMFTKSPQRYEKFTITGLKARVEQYDKENQQLKKALQNSDKYVEQLQLELRTVETESAKKIVCERETMMVDPQLDSETHEGRAEIEIVPNTMVTRQLSTHNQFEATVVSITPLNLGNPSELQSRAVTTPTSTQTASHLRETVAEQCPSPQEDAPVMSAEPSAAGCSRDLFPATKKLLALKKIHESKGLPSLPQILNVRHVSPAVDLPWPSCVSYGNYDSSDNTGEETCVPSSATSSLKTSETFPCSFTEGRSGCSESASNNVILTAAGPWAVPPTSSESHQTNFDESCQSPKRSISGEPFLLNKKIKIERD